jgi:hypothetical protein
MALLASCMTGDLPPVLALLMAAALISYCRKMSSRARLIGNPHIAPASNRKVRPGATWLASRYFLRNGDSLDWHTDSRASHSGSATPQEQTPESLGPNCLKAMDLFKCYDTRFDEQERKILYEIDAPGQMPALREVTSQSRQDAFHEAKDARALPPIPVHLTSRHSKN